MSLRFEFGSFISHGSKVVSTDTYCFYIDVLGRAIIQKTNEAGDTILYTKKPDNMDLPTFWATPASWTYTYFYVA